MSTTIVFKSYAAFLNREDRSINGVSEQFAQEHPGYEQDNFKNKGCWNCRYCIDCIEQKGEIQFPVVENIHSRILEAVQEEGRYLNMKIWHNDCGTTHCLAGWAVTLAGDQGRKLEEETDTPFAAMQILKKSSNIKVPLHCFYDNHDTAMQGIKERAELEKRW